MLIVGGGAAGLSLALMVPGAEVLEKDDEPGGLCRSRTVEGFTFDQGPHILGGIPEAVSWIVESTGIEFVEGETRNRGFVNGEFVAHPFDDPLIGERYMAKMWKADPALLTTGLSAQAGRKPGGVSRFRYPAHGGYQAITDAWAEQLGDRLHLGLYVQARWAVDVWSGWVGGARYNSLCTVTLGFEGVAPDLTAIYLPESWTPFHRVSFPSAFSPNNAPLGCFSVQLEASMNPDEPYTISHDDVDDTLGMLGIVGERAFQTSEIIHRAYPVPLADQPRTLASSHGRTGSLRYLNLDGVVAQSMERASLLVG